MPGLPDIAPADRLRAGFAEIRDELGVVVEHPGDARREAAERAAAPTTDAHAALVAADARADRRDLELVTLDPAGSKDLDQAFVLARDGDGFVLRYAIADVGAHVVPGGAIDAAAHARGQTLYAPDGRAGLHPPELAEGVASLLPGQDRLAVLWTLRIDGAGELAETEVERAVVRSRAQLDYAGAQATIDRGDPHPQLALLCDAGALLQAAQRRRGAIELPEHAQELVADGQDGWTLQWEPRHPIEADNAQLSLLCGAAAAKLMLASGSGLLRTLPPAPPEAHRRLRAAARALRIAWPDDEPLSRLLPRLDGMDPANLAFFDECRVLLRGADYTPLTGPTPAVIEHAAMGLPYAHVTAPLRRLGDRFAAECALAARHGVLAPSWARTALPALPEELRTGSRIAGALHRACIDLSEAVLLEHRVGERFSAAVVEVGDRHADVRIQSPPILARCSGDGLRAGERREVVLEQADPAERRVAFTAA